MNNPGAAPSLLHLGASLGPPGQAVHCSLQLTLRDQGTLQPPNQKELLSLSPIAARGRTLSAKPALITAMGMP